MSVLVIQMGARRGYELARMLEGRDALAALQTSTAWREGETPSWLYRQLSGVTDSVVRRRTVQGIPEHKIRTNFLPEPAGKLVESLGASRQKRYRIEDWLLGRAARRAGLAGASVILNTTGNGGISFLRWARSQGMRIASDIVITPSVYEILSEERRRWPGWEPAQNFEKDAAQYRQHIEELIAVSDLLLSPSDTVDDGLASLKGYEHDKLVRVPYGLGAAIFRTGAPMPKRVLFAGQAGLRKGLPYLAEAACLLTRQGYDIRVAGAVTADILAQPVCSSLTFLGHLGPQEMEMEFQTADVFCLPSLAEGMASVTLEALASGLPCVVTRSAGAPVQDSVNGMIIPERNGPAIANAIQTICEDRPMRARMSDAAMVTASTHRLEVVGHQLCVALLGKRDLKDLSQPFVTSEPSVRN